MTRFIGCIVALMLLSAPDVQAQSYIDGLMDRATDSAKRKAQDRLNQNIEQSIDKAIKKTEDTVKCVATDQECLRRAKEEGKQVQTVNPPAANDTMKCLVTDTGCMKQAKAQRKKVELVEEDQLDALRCSSTDTGCLTRAKSMGKKVDIIDYSGTGRLSSVTSRTSRLPANVDPRHEDSRNAPALTRAVSRAGVSA